MTVDNNMKTFDLKTSSDKLTRIACTIVVKLLLLLYYNYVQQ